MKVTALIVCALIFGNASAAPNQLHQRVDVGVIAEDLLKALFKLVGHIDPVNISELGFNILGSKVYIKNFHLEGFSNIVPEITVDIELTSIHFKLGASAQKILMSIDEWESTVKPFYGKGKAGLDLNELSFLLSFDFSYFNGFKPSTVSTALKHGGIQLTGYHNNETLSQEIVAAHDNMFNNVYPSEKFQNMIEAKVDAFLGASYKQLIEHY